ncbi:hypothetical protein [Hymenobacter sp. GOD-10R]|uniref:hypothetical protein n=1 Tax=Hymenobacter sp. GOD-10R TaxID=3093922 RepID=UPI002D76527D|nr:hypothetical protein [Hymenobacter sp. GOD-10R]WRQ31883.1 hypothetical protein SD425_29040 [Hymenobacter sp. GOD-10R]
MPQFSTPFLRHFLLLFGWLSLARSTQAQEWQWSVPVVGGKDKAGPARAFLWIPSTCKQVRGIVFAQHNMEEVSILESPQFRQEMSDLGFAEIWVSPAFNLQFNFQEGAGESLTRLLKDLAAESGYQEVAFAPLVPMGHSAAASAPYYVAAWAPERVLACVSVSGQWPYVRSNPFAPDIWGNRTIDYIPSLETMGEYEAAATWSAEGLRERQQHPLMPLSMLACPAEGHFATTAEKTAYLAFYIRKAAQYRLPKNTPKGKPPVLKPINPTRTGWLLGKWVPNQEPTVPAAPVGQYTGDPAQAFWCFDEEHVRATEKYQAQHRNQKAQLVSYVQDGRVPKQRNTHQQINLAFSPLANGVSFILRGTFLDSVGGGSPRLTTWAEQPVGTSIGHASGGGPVVINRICGPFQKLSADTFAFQMVRGLGANLRNYELWFTATHPGDAEYKPAVQQAQMIVPLRNTEGAAQHLAFPKPADLKAARAAKTTVVLAATSDAGLPVRYYVREGPAEVNGNVLHFTPLPPRSKLPLKVTVVAWQRGRTTEPKVQTAEPVEQTFYLLK